MFTGGYNRGAGTGMPGYAGGPQNTPYPNQMMGNNHMPYGGGGGPNMQMNRVAPNQNYHAQYTPQQQTGQHAGAYSGMGTPVPPMHAPANLPDINTNDDSMGGMSAARQQGAMPLNTPKGALAAAQAAMAAAANQLGGGGGNTPRPGKPMYEQFPQSVNQAGYNQMPSDSRLPSTVDGMPANSNPAVGMSVPMGGGSGQHLMVNSEMTNTHGMSGGHMVAANSHVMGAKSMNSIEMNSMPPQAMVTTSTALPPGGPLGGNTSLTSSAMNAMGPPATVPMSSHFGGNEAQPGVMPENRPSGMMTQNGMPRSDVDVSMANSSSGKCD